MTRHGKIARLPAGLRTELHQRLGHGGRIEPLTPEQRRQKMKEILALGEGFDGSKNPELTRPPGLRNRSNPELTGVIRSNPEL